MCAIFLLWSHQEGGVTGKIYTTHWISRWQREGKTWQIREMKNGFVRRGSHPGTIGREGRRWTAEHHRLHGCNASLAEISTCFHFVATWLPCPHLGHQQLGQCLQYEQRETEHSQLITRSCTVIPRQYVQYALMQSQNFQARTLGCHFFLVQSQNSKRLASSC